MVETTSNRLNHCKIPLCTTLIVLSGILVYLAPSSSTVLLYDRDGILSGELWRLLTGHLVHFSVSHLFLNLLAFGILGWMLESNIGLFFGFLWAIASVVISIVLLLVEPRLAVYGGLSGIVTTVVVYLSLQGLKRKSCWRGICIVSLLLVTTKLFFEFRTGDFFFSRVGDSISAVPMSHTIGALTGITFFFIKEVVEKVQKRRTIYKSIGYTEMPNQSLNPTA